MLEFSYTIFWTFDAILFISLSNTEDEMPMLVLYWLRAYVLILLTYVVLDYSAEAILFWDKQSRPNALSNLVELPYYLFDYTRY